MCGGFSKGGGRMVAGTDWTAEECDALIRFYFDLYERHLNGEQFNKRALIQGLMSSQLPGRSRGAGRIQDAERELRTRAARAPVPSRVRPGGAQTGAAEATGGRVLGRGQSPVEPIAPADGEEEGGRAEPERQPPPN